MFGEEFPDIEAVNLEAGSRERRARDRWRATGQPHRVRGRRLARDSFFRRVLPEQSSALP